MRRVFVSPPSPGPVLSRRREPRMTVPDTVKACSVSAGGPHVLAIRDFGFRGFAIETDRPVDPRSRARFSFTLDGRELFSADAVAVHCYHQHSPSERWISGWEFPEQPGLDAKIERVLAEAVGMITFE